MPRQRAALAWCAILLGFLVYAPTPGHSQSADPAARAFIDALNQRRSADGVPPLRLNATLLNDAEATAADLARNGSLELDLEAQEKRLRRARYPRRRIASMTAAGAAEPERLLQQYLTHNQMRKNLLSLHYSEVGVGVAARDAETGDVWVITLAEPYAAARPGWHGEIIERVNRFRAQHGLPTLVANDTLDTIAQAHSEDMAARDFFDHDSPDGRSVGDRATGAGYRYRTIAENIAAGMRRPSRVVDGWIDSPPHREAMLNPKVEEAGVGYAYDPFDDGAVRSVHYWTLNLGRR